ncbi:hypothetical protein ESA94_04780 [Lacibacter luteus]|uniref:Lipocalin-like domain-containing protein n=1 Tax=Lacibacter luteus TaxID=2508719 RepID=A0A4Q1CMR6_9BACT|nr:hypothetical protein [Lacibacter luteus]RXK62330.1 hypothetical protein ESA94_04780 [Lacibacter luteus]
MKKIFLSNIFYALTIPCLLLFSFTTVTYRANFSGEWKLDESKSELGNAAGRTARSLKAEQKENDLTISRTTPGFNGGNPVTTTFTVTYDGKTTESEGFGGSKRKSTAKWSDDGSTLTINSVMTFERDGQTMEFKSVETWSLTSEGLLSVVTQTTSSRGESTTKAVYSK